MITAVICGAGSGSRAGFSQNKLLEEYEGIPVLSRTLSPFVDLTEIDEILITCSPTDTGAFEGLIATLPKARLVAGGQTRTQSVLNALREAKGEIVLVHDGARPFLSKQSVLDCIAGVRKFGSAVCALPSTDTVALCDGGRISSVPARDDVYTLQTPQGFYTKELLAAYEQAECDNRAFTDESGIYAAYVAPPHIYLGERTNRKLTYREDFLSVKRVGFGIDTHAFGAERDYITLAGVKIPSKSGLIAHSDGDVLVHAVMDALLSAAGLKDIGYYFPDSSDEFRDADSMKLLQRVVRIVKDEGLKVGNISVSVLAETPRLAPHIDGMKQSLANALELPPSAVGIAAGTNEKLGYVGEGKGITVYAYARLIEG